MKQLKCTTCGGALELSEDGLHAKCTVCGNFYEYRNPKEDYWVEQMNEADDLRLHMDFDGAIKKYRLILNSLEGDAEAEWGLMLSKYGIVYEQDPLTEERIPTFHRNNRANIMNDENANRAIELASDNQRAVYERDLKTLRHIQAGIEEIAKKSEPYDVFISFKATEIGDTNGEIKTIDRDIAYNIYDELNSKGVKTFFSEATLATKASEDYEAVIFNALNTCKVFILVGTSKENINATWVKNEWTRYRERLIEDQKNGTLTSSHFAVLGADFDVADLPPLFARTQNVMLKNYAGDGYKRDVAKSVYNILGIDTDKPKQTESISQENVMDMVDKLIKEQVSSVPSNNGLGATINALLTRAENLIENGAFDDAKKKCDNVLDFDPDNVRAYLLKMQANYQAKTFEDIAKTARNIENDIEYKMLVKLGDADIKKKLEHLKSLIEEQKRYDAKKSIYDTAKSYEGGNIDSLKRAIQEYMKVSEFLDSRDRITYCRKRIEEIITAQKQAVYDECQQCLNNEEATRRECKEALEKIDTILDFKGAKELKTKLEDIKKELDRRQQAEWNRNSRIDFIKITIVVLLVCGVIGGICALIFCTPFETIYYKGIKYEKNAQAYFVVEVPSKCTDIYIPKKIRGIPVTNIRPDAFRFTGPKNSIEVEEGHEYFKVENGLLIENDSNQLYAAVNEETIIIPESVDMILEDAFRENNKTKSVYIPESVRLIERFAFWGCSGITVYNETFIPGFYYDKDWDEYDWGNKKINVKNGYNAVKSGDFYYTLHGDNACIVKYVGEETNVVVPEKLDGHTVIGISNAFYKNDKIVRITLPNTLKVLRTAAFYGCSNLIELIVPGSVKTVGLDVLSYCTSLRRVVLMEGVEEIKTNIYKCPELRYVVVPSTIKEIKHSWWDAKYKIDVFVNNDEKNVEIAPKEYHNIYYKSSWHFAMDGITPIKNKD